MAQSSKTRAPQTHPTGNFDPVEFHRWVVALAAIRFDLEQGQLVEELFPPGTISPEEETDVAFSSFPDSMSTVHNRSSLYDCMFFFRIRRRGVASNPVPPPGSPPLRATTVSSTSARESFSPAVSAQRASSDSQSGMSQPRPSTAPLQDPFAFHAPNPNFASSSNHLPSLDYHPRRRPLSFAPSGRRGIGIGSSLSSSSAPTSVASSPTLRSLSSLPAPASYTPHLPLTRTRTEPQRGSPATLSRRSDAPDGSSSVGSLRHSAGGQLAGTASASGDARSKGRGVEAGAGRAAPAEDTARQLHAQLMADQWTLEGQGGGVSGAPPGVGAGAGGSTGARPSGGGSLGGRDSAPEAGKGGSVGQEAAMGAEEGGAQQAAAAGGEATAAATDTARAASGAAGGSASRAGGATGAGGARHSTGSTPTAASSSSSAALKRIGSSSGSGSGPRFLYGFVFNRQRQDHRLRRGGEQKSVVVLTERPFSAVFKSLVQVAGPLYFDHGAAAFPFLAAFISSWPPPTYGAPMELPIASSMVGLAVQPMPLSGAALEAGGGGTRPKPAGSSSSGTTSSSSSGGGGSAGARRRGSGPRASERLRVQVPPAHTLPPSAHSALDDFTSAMAPVPHSNALPQGIFHEADLFSSLHGVLPQLWLLWELLLVGEPLLVLAPTPTQCSEAVAALVGLVAPLPLSMDFRPYFTIHDPDFPSFNALRDGDPLPPVLLGVTNLFFLKALKALPNVLSVGRPPHGGQGVGGASRFQGNAGGVLHPNSQVAFRPASARLSVPSSSSSAAAASSTGLRRLAAHSIMSVFSAGSRSVARMRREGPLSLMAEHREALWSNFAPVLRADTQVLNSLVDSSGSGAANVAAGGSAGLGSAASAPGAGVSGGGGTAGIGWTGSGSAAGANGGSAGGFANLDPSKGADAASAAILAISGSIANTLLTGSGSLEDAAEGLFGLSGAGSSGLGGAVGAGGGAAGAGAASAAAPLETVSMINNGILKSHFLEMTTNFLAPFGPFLRAAAPQEGASPFCDPPPLPAFDAALFLEQLAARGPGKFLAKRVQPGGSWLELYRRFLEGPNFMPWFQRRRAVAEAEQHRLWREARAASDVAWWMDRMGEGEVMEAYVCVEEQLKAELKALDADKAEPLVVAKLRWDLRKLFGRLLPGAQEAVIANEARAALLRLPAGKEAPPQQRRPVAFARAHDGPLAGPRPFLGLAPALSGLVGGGGEEAGRAGQEGGVQGGSGKVGRESDTGSGGRAGSEGEESTAWAGWLFRKGAGKADSGGQGEKAGGKGHEEEAANGRHSNGDAAGGREQGAGRASQLEVALLQLTPTPSGEGMRANEFMGAHYGVNVTTRDSQKEGNESSVVW